jgi:hypothetical protein
VPDERTQPELTDDLIARRAFELWLTNGSPSPQDNWVRAEQELRAELGLQKDA